jgi:hypothetical protein
LSQKTITIAQRVSYRVIQKKKNKHHSKHGLLPKHYTAPTNLPKQKKKAAEKTTAAL